MYKCILVYPVGYEKINVVGKVLLKAGRALILWTENIKHKCFPVNGRAICLYEPSRCKSVQGKKKEFRAGSGWLNTYIRAYTSIHTYIGKGNVHPRSGHEGPEGGRCIAPLFL
jgi:hypothetical protein